MDKQLYEYLLQILPSAKIEIKDISKAVSLIEGIKEILNKYESDSSVVNEPEVDEFLFDD